MPPMTPKRKKHLNRRKNGTFGPWKGGKKKSQLKKKRNSFQGISIHLGKEFKRQHGRTMKPGDIVRTKKKDGTYHKQAEWYVKTPHGMRKSRTQFKRPTKAQIKNVIKNSRPGRPHKK